MFQILILGIIISFYIFSQFSSSETFRIKQFQNLRNF